MADMLSIAEVVNVLKVVHAPKITNLLNTFFDVDKEFQSWGVERQIGEKWVTPVQIQTTDNVGFTGSDFKLPALGGNMDWKRPETVEVWMHGIFGLTIQLMTRMQGRNEASYGEAENMISGDLINSLMHRRSLVFFGGQDGVVATMLAAPSGGKYATANAINSTYLRVNKPLGWTMGDGTTAMTFKKKYLQTVFPKNTRIYLSNATTSADSELVTVSDYGTVDGDNYDVLVLKSALVHDQIGEDVTVYFATSPTQISGDPTGVETIVARGMRDLFMSDTYMGLTESEAPVWAPTRITNNGTPEDLETSHFRDALIQTEDAVHSYPDLWIANTAMMGSLENLPQDQTRFIPQQGKMGMEAFDYNLFGRKVKRLLFTRFCPPGVFLGLDTSHMIKYILKEGEFDESNGQILSRIEGYDAFVGMWRMAFNQGTDKRNSHAIIQDINVE